MKRKCSVCGKYKDATKNHTCFREHQKICIDCNRLRVQEWYKANSTYKKAYVCLHRNNLLPDLKKYKELPINQKIDLIYVLMGLNE